MSSSDFYDLAVSHSVVTGIVILAVFVLYAQIENHILNPLIMSRTVKISSLLVLLSVLAAYSIGTWIGGLFGGFVACLLAVPGTAAIRFWAVRSGRRTRCMETAGPVRIRGRLMSLHSARPDRK